MTRPSRIGRRAILAQLKLAAKKGDRPALTLAIEQMRTWAFSPRYWEKYLDLLTHPLARLVDLTVIKQGEKIAHQKGWVRPRREPARPAAKAAAGRSRSRGKRRGRPAAAAASQPTLFPDLD
ncbi:MAG TPA: hypothetical protein VFO18_18790 [Methylomirabilota bacterium]|nr:hypothetical protein [Methylomirabilota bacterium]